MLDELDGLSSRPPDELDRALRGLLDAYSHRLDAWYTSLATRRLAALRSTTPDGVHLGAYGWLDELRPATDAGVNHGFVHAPSLPQAATAAVLRSGHLAHHDAEHQALEIDLTAERVRTALTLLDGVEQGQPLAALLGLPVRACCAGPRRRASRSTSCRSADWCRCGRTGPPPLHRPPPTTSPPATSSTVSRSSSAGVTRDRRCSTRYSSW